MSLTDKISLINQNLKEVVGKEVMEKILDKRNLNIYWGTATTGKPHIAYFLPIFKIKDFVDAGCNVTILLADIHAFLDNLKAPIEKIECRTVYYKKIISLMLESLKVDLTKINFVLGSSFQRSNEYFNDIMRILNQTNQNDAKRAGSEVVKQVSNSKLSSLVYPAMQALDEEYLKVDVQFGGVDQRKIFMYAREFLPIIKYKKRIHLMNPMIPGLNSEKMSSSDKDSKIDLLDTEEEIKKKISHCNLENEGLMSLFKCIIYPYCDIYNLDVIVSNKKYSFKELSEDFKKNKLNGNSLKNTAAEIIEKIVKPIRTAMMEESDIIEKAYEK
ncbi:tyrosine-tRNA ligase (YARS1) [Vairimorpha necatrix]|uniref:Tyrosine--tRNA ligase n=1 Tax=Vairimorpha necatrix TaxID=6039 RepID=A0AAX4JD76_9MICR